MRFWLEKNGEQVLPVLVCDGDNCSYRERAYAAVLLARRLARGGLDSRHELYVVYDPRSNRLLAMPVLRGKVMTGASGSIERLKLYGYEYKEGEQ